MKKYLLCLPLVAGSLMTSTLYAQTTLPYVSGFDNAVEKAGWQQIRNGSDGLNEWRFNPDMPYSPTESLSHNYPVGGTTVTDDWFVSPPFSLPEGGSVDSLRYNFSGFGVPAETDTIALYLLVGDPNPEEATSVTLLHDFRGEDYVGDGQWRIMESIDLPSTSTTAYIAFRYKTTVNWLDIKFDNISVSGEGTTSINLGLTATNSLAVFPNPTTGKLHLQSEAALKEISIVDIAGRILHQQTFSSEIDLSEFENGIYIISCSDLKNNIIVKRVIKL